MGEINVDKENAVGIVLSGATTREASCQLLKSAEKGEIREGMLLIVKSGNRRILSRVSQIIPYNAFYTEGDAWSEARREGRPIPEYVARQYEICKLELLIEIPKKEIEYPPRPGDQVIKLDLSTYKDDYKELLFGVSKPRINKNIYKGIIDFGSLSGYQNLPVPLDVEKIPMHLAIFGVTGSGKSFNTGYLIEKLVNIPKNDHELVAYPLIIIDAHGDYLDYVHYVEDNRLENIEWIKSGWVKRFIFPNIYYENPEFRKSTLIEPIGINLDLLEHTELAEMIVTYLKGSTEGAEQQISGLVTAFEILKDKGYYSLHQFFSDNAKRKKLQETIEKLSDKPYSYATATIKAIKRQLDEFFKLEDTYKLFSSPSPMKDENFVDNITQNRGIAIVDFSAEGAPGVELKTKQLVMAYLATILFRRFTEYKLKGEQRYLLFIIEEAQNFCPDKSYPISTSLAHSKLSAIATQGRKFGLSLCLISQRPSFVDRIILSMCNTFFIHRVSPEDVYFVKTVTGGLPSSLVSRLTTLETGQLIITGQLLTVPFPVVVKVDYNERKVRPTIGETNVIDNL
ncbi:MAG: ATP-binding protein [Thermoproteales archaeon]|nr:ATP-binding protein [Thermoproteales archaeon]